MNTSRDSSTLPAPSSHVSFQDVSSWLGCVEGLTCHSKLPLAGTVSTVWRSSVMVLPLFAGTGRPSSGLSSSGRGSVL